MKKLGELARQRNQDLQPLQPPINRPPRDIPPPYEPPVNVMDDRIIKSGRQLSGIGGYLNPSQIDDFVNPPVPSNEAGIMDMARLLQQQRDTFGNMLTYPDPPDEGGGTGGGGTGGGTGGGGTGGGTGGGGTGGGGTEL